MAVIRRASSARDAGAAGTRELRAVIAGAGFMGRVHADAVRRSGGRGEAPDGLPVFADELRAVRIADAVLRSGAAGGAWTAVPA